MILTRFAHFDTHIIGILTYKEHAWFTVERPYLDNQTFISAIPDGEYRMRRVNSPAHGPDTWRIMAVPGRRFIDLHIANRARQLEGCIGVGKYLFKDMSGVTQSERAIQELYAATEGVRSERITIMTAPILNNFKVTAI